MKQGKSVFWTIGYVLWSILAISQITYLPNLSSNYIFVVVLPFLMLQEICNKRWTKQTLLFILLCLLLTIYSSLYNPSNLLLILLILFTSRNIDIKHISYISVIVITVMFLVIILLSQFDIILNDISYRGSIKRYSLGFIGRTYASYFVLAILAYYGISAYPKYNKYILFIILLLNIYIYVMTNTRNSFYLSLILICYLFVNRNSFKSLISSISIFVFPACIGLMYVLSFIYDSSNPILVKINDFMSYRLAYAHDVLLNNRITFFGSQIDWTQSKIVDCSYIRILLDYGIIGFIVIISIQLLAVFYAHKTINIYYKLLCIIFAINFSFDPTIYTIYLNPLLFLGTKGLYEILRQSYFIPSRQRLLIL